ncbi:hypothetical protein DERF_012452, partial [Dermatophagoides farinae]
MVAVNEHLGPSCLGNLTRSQSLPSSINFVAQNNQRNERNQNNNNADDDNENIIHNDGSIRNISRKFACPFNDRICRHHLTMGAGRRVQIPTYICVFHLMKKCKNIVMDNIPRCVEGFHIEPSTLSNLNEFEQQHQQAITCFYSRYCQEECAICGDKICEKRFHKERHYCLKYIIHTNIRFPCRISGCGKSLSHQTSVYRHVQCNKNYASFNMCKHHISYMHHNEVIRCPVDSCNQIYRYPSNLYRHIRKNHKLECPFLEDDICKLNESNNVESFSKFPSYICYYLNLMKKCNCTVIGD